MAKPLAHCNRKAPTGPCHLRLDDRECPQTPATSAIDLSAPTRESLDSLRTRAHKAREAAANSGLRSNSASLRRQLVVRLSLAAHPSRSAELPCPQFEEKGPRALGLDMHGTVYRYARFS